MRDEVMEMILERMRCDYPKMGYSDFTQLYEILDYATYCM